MIFSIRRYFICCNGHYFGLYLLRKCSFYFFAPLLSSGKLFWVVFNQCLPQTVNYKRASFLSVSKNLHYKIPSNNEVCKMGWLLIRLINWFLLAPHYHKKSQPTTLNHGFFWPLSKFCHSRKKILPLGFLRGKTKFL